MGFLSRLAGLFARNRGEAEVATEEKMTVDEWFRAFEGQLATASGTVVNQHTAMQVATVLACVRIRAQDVAKLPPKIYRLRSDGSRVEAKDHYLYQIFRRPNEQQSWFEFCETMQMAMLLRGNAYAAVVRDARSKPLAMVPINPDRVSIWESPAPDGRIFYQVSRGTPYEVSVLAGFPQRISADDMFHLRWASNNTLVGLSPIGLNAEAIGLAKSQERLAANLMGNGARPSGVLSTDKHLNNDALKRIKASWEAAHGGISKTGGTAVLEEGLKWQPLTLNSVDLEFIASRNFQVEQICQIFGVSPVKIGVMSSSVGRAFADIQLAHYADAVHPDMERWEQKLQHYFMLEDDLDIEFDETELLRSDLKSRADAARILQVSGITTPNESRASFGLNPYKARDPAQAPDGDTLFTPNNVVPIESAGQVSGPGVGSDQSGAPAAGGSGDPAAVDGPST